MEGDALEQSLRDRPADLVAWRAYGDRLRGKDGARGRLIDLEHRRTLVDPAGREAPGHEIDQLVTEHRPRLGRGAPARGQGPGPPVRLRHQGRRHLVR